jgi:hypothetical protein
MKHAVLGFPVEIRAEKNGDTRKIIGTAAVFDKMSEDLGGFREKIAPGAFSKTLSEGGTKKAYWNHNSDRVLGSTKAGTLKLEERKDGLYFEIDPPSWADEHLESIERGDVDQMSFGFRTIKDNWMKDHDTGKVIRELLEVQLFEVSPVAMPAYPQTDAQVRSLETDKLKELLIQLDHNLLDDGGLAELRALFVDVQKRIDANHSAEPDHANHSEEPEEESDAAKEESLRSLKNRLRMQSALMGEKNDH